MSDFIIPIYPFSGRYVLLNHPFSNITKYTTALKTKFRDRTSLKLMRRALTNFNDKDKPTQNTHLTGNRKNKILLAKPTVKFILKNKYNLLIIKQLQIITI
jgi:hypothetical protein